MTVLSRIAAKAPAVSTCRSPAAGADALGRRQQPARTTSTMLTPTVPAPAPAPESPSARTADVFMRGVAATATLGAMYWNVPQPEPQSGHRRLAPGRRGLDHSRSAGDPYPRRWQAASTRSRWPQMAAQLTPPASNSGMASLSRPAAW
jgi:hypothetical protein